jgi:hypothetical protein
MNGRTRTGLIAVFCLILIGCGRDETPVPEASPGEVPTSQPSAVPMPEPSATPSVIASSEPTGLAGIAYTPKNECISAPGWPAFHKSLVAAIRARDSAALAAIAAPDITLDYGGGSGVGELQKRLADPERQLWQELAALLPLGCAIDGGLAAMPWIFWNVPETADSYTAMLVTGRDVPLRDEQKGANIGNVGWFIVDIDPMEFKPDEKLTQVTLTTGETGLVETSRLRSLLDYRLIAEPHEGGWKITAFIAGD